jgi:hypothetical protein
MKKTIKQSRAGQPVTSQTVDITANTPAVSDTNPFWGKDEQSIVFQSNRADLQGITLGTLTHIYRMRPDGSVLEALTGPLSSPVFGATNSQSEPAYNSGSSAVVYIDSDGGGSLDLLELNLNTRTTPRTLIKNNPQGYTFVGLNHPEYGFAPGGSVGVIFAGKRTTDASFHLFAVDTQSGNVTQLTSGSADDRNPTLSPDSAKPVIAFDSNRANASGSVTKAKRDIWVVGTNPNGNNAVQVTNFAAGGQSSENIQPAWSTNKIDQPGGQQQFINGQQLIAFASTRYDIANDGNANGINPNGTHDIYWLKVNIGPDPNNNSQFTITTPESSSNVSLKLASSDPQHKYDDLHPTWPQFISTYRVAYQSDRTFYNTAANDSGPAGQPFDIFASTLLDINAPSLIRFDVASGDVLNVQPRIGIPGGAVKISAKVADFETGIRNDTDGGGVFVQIKNPNSKYQSADNKEHKVYITGGFTPDNSNFVFTNFEYEMERIFIGADSSDSRENTYAKPRYNASVDDFFAFTGSTSAPDAGWLPLKFESRDATTGISTYSANWTTDRFPSDYVIDLIVYDNAVNPFSTSSFDRASNWKIYDNVWGFTTQNFQPAHNLLFVSDYSAGQKFFNSRFGTSVLTNVANTFWGTESWMTDIQDSLLPTRYVNGTTIGTVVAALNALGVKSYGAFDPNDFGTNGTFDPSVIDGTKADGADVPATQQYDLWRILCRGALPAAVLQQYTPHTEQQPPDTLNGEKTPRTVVVANRCIIWHAPYTGDLFTGAGTLTDLSVQSQLHGFLQAGGRLFVNGQDVGWALTLDGTNLNSFFSDDLRAIYVNDQDPGVGIIDINVGPFPVSIRTNPIYALQTTGNPDVITYDPWRDPAATFPIEPPHIYYGPPFPPGYKDNVSNETNYITAGVSGTDVHELACLGVVYPDEIKPGLNVTSDMRFGNGNTGLQHYADGTTGQRVAYCSFGLEGLNADAFGVPGATNVIALKNRRTEVLHNIVCWLRTGTMFGIVRDTQGSPLSGVLVRLANRSTAQGVPIYAYTAITLDDGSYVINGVESGQYAVTAFKPGYSIQKRTGNSVHGGWRSDMSFRLTLAEPAVIKGKVTRIDGTTPVVGATVTAKDNFTPATFTGISDSSGNYSIDRVPSQTTYTLTVTAPGFGASIPVNYLVNDPADPSGNNFLQAAKTYQPYDFKLKAVPGSVTGFVYKKNADGSQGPAIPNAIVTATSGGATVTATTDSNGAYSFDTNNTPSNGIDPGSVSLVATAPGYAPNAPITISVVSGQPTVAPPILLSPVAPGSISGLVTRTSDNTALPGVLIQLKDPSGNIITSTTTTTVQSDGTNYRITSVPAGVTYTVIATKSGFTANPLTQNAAVTTGVETKNVNFQMDPLHTFAGQLSLVSSPYDYGSNPANVEQLLSVPDGDPAFLFATWDIGRYAFFPTPPADRFRLGRGYFLGYKTNLPLSTVGTTADTTRPFDITLNPGWNLIGDPFLLDIDWTKVAVVDGGVVKTHDQAVSTGAIGSALYSYVSGTYILNFKISPWAGYWVRAYRSVTLRIDPINDLYGRAAAVGGTSRAVLQGGDGWSVNLRVNAGQLRDEDNYLGVSSRAVDGFDQFKAEKPPVFGDKYLALTFDHTDWGQMSGGYGVDVRSASTGTKVWNFTVNTTAANTRASITWPNVSTIRRGTTLYLTDTVTGQVQDLRTTSSYSWQTGETPAPRKFRVEAIRSDATNTLRVTNVVVQSSRSPGSPVTISYNLSMPANVEIIVRGAAGNQVRHVTGRASRAAGINEVTWDQKTDQNVAVPSGSYSVEIRAQSTDGRTTAKQLAQILVVR